jgi:hypothetical protein
VAKAGAKGLVGRVREVVKIIVDEAEVAVAVVGWRVGTGVGGVGVGAGVGARWWCGVGWW